MIRDPNIELTLLAESDWQKLSTDEIAVQLTLISHDLLKKIPIRQFIDHPWISKRAVFHSCSSYCFSLNT